MRAKIDPQSAVEETADSSKSDLSPSDPFDGAVLELAVQAAFLEGFAKGLAEDERPVEEVAPQKSGGEIDFGWRAGLRW